MRMRTGDQSRVLNVVSARPRLCGALFLMPGVSGPTVIAIAATVTVVTKFSTNRACAACATPLLLWLIALPPGTLSIYGKKKLADIEPERFFLLQILKSDASPGHARRSLGEPITT